MAHATHEVDLEVQKSCTCADLMFTKRQSRLPTVSRMNCTSSTLAICRVL